MMQIHTYDTAAQVGQAAAILIGAQVLQKPESVLGLATGSSPIPTYRELIRLYQAGVLDFSHATAFNLDEYCQLPTGHPCSYRYFMDQELFAHINLPAERRHMAGGTDTPIFLSSVVSRQFNLSIVGLAVGLSGTAFPTRYAPAAFRGLITLSIFSYGKAGCRVFRDLRFAP